MKFIRKSYSLYTKDIHQIWCRSAKFLWKAKFCSGSGSGSGSWFYFGFYFGIFLDPLTPSKVIVSTSKVHVRTSRQTDRQTAIFFSFVLSSKTCVREELTSVWERNVNRATELVKIDVGSFSLDWVSSFFFFLHFLLFRISSGSSGTRKTKHQKK